MWVQATLAGARTIGRMSVNYGKYDGDRPRRFAVEVLDAAGEHWTEVDVARRVDIDKFAFHNGHPVYTGASRETMAMEPVTTRSVRLRITEPSPGRSWTMTELELFAQPEDDGE